VSEGALWKFEGEGEGEGEGECESDVEAEGALCTGVS
jgi:hypothetical protein